MSISIKAKTDYSALFGSTGASGNNSSNYGINLADYASIKNGSYGKLIKAYYAKQTDDTEESSKTTEDKVSSLQKVASVADGLKKSADKLITRGSDSLFNEKNIESTDENGKKVTSKGYDKDAIYSAVKDFADNYNSFINKAKKSSESSVSNRAESLANMMTVNFASLKAVGIGINDDDTLKVDEETFKKADMSSVKSLFNGNQSLAYQVTAQASMIGTSATTAANAASGYTSAGSYAQSYSAGSMINGIV